MPAPTSLPDAALDELAERFRLLAEPTRLRLICRLSAGERCVGDLADDIGCTQANVSKHLSLLAEAGVLRRRRAGLNCYYTVADASVFALCDAAWDSVRRHLDARAEAVRIPD